MKQSKPEHAGPFRKGPDHVALVFSEFENEAELLGSANQSELENFPKNIIETAVRFGVQFLTFCCPDKNEADGKLAVSVDLKILFDLLLMDHNWLRSENIAVRFPDNSDGRNMPNKSKLNISVISQIDGRSAIVGAVQNLAKKIEQGEMASDDITSQMLSEQVVPYDLPDPDLLVFTGGLRRLQNGFIWQSAYSELAFVDERCQDLSAEHFQRILEDYLSRDRRFGGLAKLPKSNLKAGWPKKSSI